MQHDTTPPAKIRHTPVAKYRKQFRSVMEAFAKEVSHSSDSYVDLQTFATNDTNLLTHRRALVRMVKEGMLERKDMEPEIAMLAAIVWYLRLDKARQERVMGMW